MILPTVVGVGEVVVVDEPSTLVGMALGSCVALMLYDLRAGVAGMAHVMLPAAPEPDTPHAGRYADTAVRTLLEEMLSRGARKGLVMAKLVGGSQMFSVNNEGHAIGERNVEALESLLRAEHVPLVAQDTGGKRARTVEFDTRTGLALIRTAHDTERCL